MKHVARYILLLLLIPLAIQAAPYEEGTHYQRIIPPQATETPGKIEVVELFWYGCPHCHRFQPYMERWLKQKPADVEYRRMPVILGEHWALLAKAYYTAEVLGIVDKIHRPLFDAIHAQKRRMDNDDRVMEFFMEQGVTKEAFLKAYNSFAVDAKVRRSREMGRRYQTQATPSVVINGKYILNPDNAEGNYNTMIKIIDYLVEQERNASKG